MHLYWIDWVVLGFRSNFKLRTDENSPRDVYLRLWQTAKRQTNLLNFQCRWTNASAFLWSTTNGICLVVLIVADSRKFIKKNCDRDSVSSLHANLFILCSSVFEFFSLWLLVWTVRVFYAEFVHDWRNDWFTDYGNLHRRSMIAFSPATNLRSTIECAKSEVECELHSIILIHFKLT